MKALANLHESLEWLNLRLRKTFARLNADVNAEGDILMNLNNILSKFQSVSEQCLLYLHMEQRVRCFLYLGQIFRGARFDVKERVKLLDKKMFSVAFRTFKNNGLYLSRRQVSVKKDC